jgi:hypothetical protein
MIAPMLGALLKGRFQNNLKAAFLWYAIGLRLI